MPVPPFAPEGKGVARWVPAAPFRFTAAATVPVLSLDAFDQVGVLEEDTGCRAVEVAGAWVLAEDYSGHRGWVPPTAVPVWRPGARATAAVIVSGFVTAGVGTSLTG